MSTKLANEKHPRHKLALDTARYEALKAGNTAARTDFKTSNDGAENPSFRRVYVSKFVEIYARVVHGN